MSTSTRTSLRGRSLFIMLVALAVTEGVVLGIWWFRDPNRARSSSPVLRGHQVAKRLGCFSCHGPEGSAGLPNPGAGTGSVPSWSGGTFMMYNETPEEIREWVLDGIAVRLRSDPIDQERRSRQLISMPAYRGRLTEPELEDLVSYVQSVSGAFRPPEAGGAAAGRELAVSNGCFGCHGPEGRGLLRNPGSLRGYIPPWDSPDYPELVKSPEEFREWVADGEIRRFRENPAAAFFLDNQAIKMPPFRDILNDSDIESLRAYVEWIRARPRPAP